LQGGDPSLRRRAVAALSELVFYGAAECMSRRDCISLPSGFLLVRPAKLPLPPNCLSVTICAPTTVDFIPLPSSQTPNLFLFFVE
jgi:hypothetical protein